MQYRIKVGVLGWIDKNGPWPILSGNGALALADQMRSGPFFWVVNTYMGLMATANDPPSQNPLPFKTYRAKRDFRVMLWADVLFDDAGQGRLAGPPAQALIVDDGTTPPVDTAKVGAMQKLITSMEVGDALVDQAEGAAYRLRHPFGGGTPPTHPKTWWAQQLADMTDPNPYPAEHSPLSRVYFDRQHDNTVFPALGPGERLVVNGLHRFRAGTHTDMVGMREAHSAYHVPWVWAEFLLTTTGGGRVRLRGASSIFPTVAFYLDDRQVQPVHRQATDSAFPPLGLLDAKSMKIWPVLSAGAPASAKEPTLASDNAFAGKKIRVTNLPWSCPGGPFVDVNGTARPATVS